MARLVLESQDGGRGLKLVFQVLEKLPARFSCCYKKELLSQGGELWQGDAHCNRKQIRKSKCLLPSGAVQPVFRIGIGRGQWEQVDQSQVARQNI